MILIDDSNKNKCCGCGACSSICPKAAISMKTDSEGFIYPFINNQLCINCGACNRVCPFLKEYPLKEDVDVIAAKSLNEGIRSKSSSGGIFSIIAEHVLNKCGVVYGTSMGNDCKEAINTRILNINELEKLRGSKYLQSSMNDSFKNIKIDLESKRVVLFSGTPCQVFGLKSYLGKEYDNLFTIEIICHGVPSPLLWNKYVDYLENKYHSRVTEVNFREKKTNSNRFGIQKKKDAICIYNSVQTDPYLVMFLNNCCLRPSCYNCLFKDKKSQADLTLGDFWGVQNITPEIDDKKGISLVLIQSQKGKMLLEHISDNIAFMTSDYNLAIAHNSSYYLPVTKPATRDMFYFELEKKPFKSILSRYAKLKFKTRINAIIRSTELFAFFDRRKNVKNFSYGIKILLKKSN